VKQHIFTTYRNTKMQRVSWILVTIFIVYSSPTIKITVREKKNPAYKVLVSVLH